MSPVPGRTTVRVCAGKERLMRRHLGNLLATLLVVAAVAVAAQPARGQTIAVVTVKSVDTLKSDVRYLAELAGQEELAKNLDAMVDTLTRGKELGVDSARP